MRPHFGGLAIADITAAHVAEYKRCRFSEAAAATVGKEMHLLSAAINHANAEWDWHVPNPMHGRIPTPPDGRIRWITHDEADSLLEAAASRRRAPYLVDMVRLALHTGLRHRELLNLAWNRVDESNSLIYLYSADQKSQRVSSIPLNKSAQTALNNRRGIDRHRVFTYQGQPIASAKKSFRAACRQAGIDDFTIHDLRHTTASWMIQRGVSLAAVKEVMRHRSIQTTMRYAHLAPENTRAAVAALDWDSIGTHNGQNGADTGHT
ncbi:site-specific integrase [Salinisphaera sp. USBA-960]|nr:site-specific integrase [Salifodinibacter halophilus]NNC25274.1 site-specific integrase [Salifodinibacter halophilus]